MHIGLGRDGTNTTFGSYYKPLGIFQVNALQWANLPMNASGYYECRDKNDQNAPPSSINITVYGKVRRQHLSSKSYFTSGYLVRVCEARAR